MLEKWNANPSHRHVTDALKVDVQYVIRPRSAALNSMGGAFGREVSAEKGCGLEDQELGTRNRASLTCRGWTAIPSSFFSQAKVSVCRTMRLGNRPITITRREQVAQLTALTISLNDIVELPAEMCLLSALTSLDASNNEIGHIHAAALHLPHLQELGLAFNRLVDLPNDLGNLTTLHRLTLQVIDSGTYIFFLRWT